MHENLGLPKRVGSGPEKNQEVRNVFELSTEKN